MAFETTADVAALQARCEIEWSDLDAAFTTCQLAGKIPASSNDADQWAALHARVVAFDATEPSTLHASSQAKTGRAILDDLQPWYDKLRNLGCANVPPTPAPSPEPSNPLDSLGKTITTIALVWLAIEAMRTFRK
jgi:hypothetical protein